MTKHFIRTAHNAATFEAEMDKVSKEQNVFASQTHVNLVNGSLVYTAVIFAKD